MTDINIGSIAPEFTCDSTHGELSLENFKCNIVLYFYPKDATPGCTIQAQEFSSLYTEFKKLNAEVIGVSRDNLSSHERFCDKEGIKYPLLADTETKVCNLYGVFKPKIRFSKSVLGINRTTFLIGKDKKILKIWKNVRPLGHAEAVLNTIKTINLIPNKLKTGAV